MTLGFFADQCVPRSVIDALRGAHHNVFRLKDFIPADSSDVVVISKAQELNSILLSLNGDFTDIVTYPPEQYKGIISIQLENHPEILPDLLTNLLSYLKSHDDMTHYAGKLFITEAYRIRIRQ